jgi:hypothetical protein
VKTPGANFGVSALLLLIGVVSLYRFSENLFHFAQNVRTVDVVGLTGGGAACGAAIFSFVFALIVRNKERRSSNA